MLRAVLAFVLISISGGWVYGQAAVDIPHRTWDFGNMVQNSTVKHTFTIKSTGKDTLRITRVEPGCGCTQVPLTDSVLAPGEEVPFEVIFHTRRFSGAVHKTPRIYTNAGDESVDLTLLGRVYADPEEMVPLIVRPFEVDVSQFTKTPRRRTKFLIENRSEHELKLSMISDDDPHFDIDLPGEIKPGETAEATITVKEDRLSQDFEQSVTFKVNDDGGTRYTIPVRRLVRIKSDG